MARFCAAMAGAFMLLGSAAAAQQTAAPPATGGPRVAKARSANPFDVVGWLSFDPVGSSLIAPPKQAVVATRGDQEFITVYGHRKGPDVGPRPITGYTPADNGAALPRDIPLLPPTGCSNSAYRTIAGQPATSADLIGYLGAGGC